MRFQEMLPAITAVIGMGLFAPTIAVGTPVSRRPPHRSELAELAHSALALGAEAESRIGVGVRDAGRR
jgi:hypothetical protein